MGHINDDIDIKAELEEREYLAEKLAEEEPTHLANGFEKAFIGWFTRVGKPTVCVYDIDKCLAILMLRDNMTEEAAREYLEFNTIGAWVGEGTPAFMQRGSFKEFKDGQDL
jgi:hypothetical protein